MEGNFYFWDNLLVTSQKKTENFYERFCMNNLREFVISNLKNKKFLVLFETFSFNLLRHDSSCEVILSTISFILGAEVFSDFLSPLNTQQLNLVLFWPFRPGLGRDYTKAGK